VSSLAGRDPSTKHSYLLSGFTRTVGVKGWLSFEAAGTDGATKFTGVIESPRHIANECRNDF